jgi:ADP-ribosyl-[dinitrogen reductase] hydrolase
MFISTLDRVEGLLIGLATGDALGAPFEGREGTGFSVREMYSGGLHERKAGEVTDDTLQAMAVAGSLVHCHGFNPGDLVTRLIAGYSTSSEWYGPTSSRVFDLILQGQDPFVAAKTVYSCSGTKRTNGSVMRGPPLGVAFSGPHLEKVSLLCSRLTHADSTSGWCSAFINRMASRLVRGAPRQAAFEDACSRCRDPEVLGRLGLFREYEPVSSIDSVLSTHAALWAFMTTGSFREAVGTAAGLGGDADTVAAVCGALAGSYYGISSVPARWLIRLQYRESLFRLADSLYSTFMPVRVLGADGHVF